MLDRDMRPTRFDLTLQYAREFIVEWFDQNPLGQIGVVGMRAGIGERVGEMSGVLLRHLESLTLSAACRKSSGCLESYR
jgi:transcription initiation factor TFIIH subunit 2